MTESVFQFDEASRIGSVRAVDTAHVVIDVDTSSLLSRCGVGNLLAIRGSTQNEYLVAIIERVNRSEAEGIADDEVESEIPIVVTTKDVLRAFLVGTFRHVDGDRKNVFKRGADSYPQIDRECFVVDGPNLQRFMASLGQHIPEGERLVLGHYTADTTALAIADGDKFFQRHASILGSTGSGKSWAVALLLEKAKNLKYPNLIVFDMHGEYSALCDEPDAYASQFRIAGPGDLKEPTDEVLFLPYWLLNREEMLSMILDRSDQNAPNQASRFTSHVRALKEKTLIDNSKSDVAKTFTVDSPIPYPMTDLLGLLKRDDTEKGVGAKGQPVKGEWEGKLTRFISRLEAKLEDRRYGFMFEPPQVASAYEWLSRQVVRLLGSTGAGSGIKVVDFSEVPSDVLPVVAGTMARLLYQIQFWTQPERRTPFAFVCDEAHLYLPVRSDADAVQRQALESFERIAKEGRKYGVSIVAVSQRPSDVSKTILSQCNNFVVLRLTNVEDQNVVRRLVPDSIAGVTDILPLLDTGEALLLGDSILLPARIKIDAPSRSPQSATRDFWSDWNTTPTDSKAIDQAVENLRRQSRVSEEDAT